MFPTEITVGNNSGPALVGNIGSIRKFKYGPIGQTVSLGSRVQGATKWLRSSLLITQSAANDLDPNEFDLWRLCRVRVVNINEPVTLFELAAEPANSWSSLNEQYERATEAFGCLKFDETMQALKKLIALAPDDGPSVSLLQRTREAMQNPDAFDDVWTLRSK